MKLIYLFIIPFLMSDLGNSQNLIANGGFEQYWSCPTDIGQISLARYWINPDIGAERFVNSLSGCL